LTKKESEHSSNKKDDVGKVFVIKDQQLVVEEIIAEGWFQNSNRSTAYILKTAQL